MSLKIEQFKRIIEPFLGDYQSLDVRIVAHHFQNLWLFNAVRILFDNTPLSKPIYKNIPNIKNLLVAHERWDLSRLDELLEYILKGEIINDKNIINIKRIDGQELKPINYQEFRFYDRNYCKSTFGTDFSSFVLQIYEGSRISYEEQESIDNQLLSAEIPWDGLSDLRRNFIGYQQDWASRTDSFLHIIAPLYLSLKEVKLKNANIKFVIDRINKIDNKKVTIAAIAHFPDNSIERVSRNVQEDESSITFKSSPTRAIAIVRCNDFVVDRIELFGETQNKRIKLFENMREHIQDFAKDIKDSRGREFEDKICFLFHLLGFSPAHYGVIEDDVPDIIAFNESNENVVIIECTAREPDLNNKLTKLSTRSKEISKILEGKNIHPMIVTAFDRSMINRTDEEKASKENISVMTQDEISTLIQMALNKAPSKEIITYLSGLVPKPIIGY